MRSNLIFFTTLFSLLSCREDAQTSVIPIARPEIPPTVSAGRRTPIVVAVHNVLPSVVNIEAEGTMRQRSIDPFFGFFGGDQLYKTQAVGSGFVWARDGIIVTNAHVTDGASRLTVNLQDGRSFPARVVGVDTQSDVAVLKVDARDLPAAPVGSSGDLLIGETVIAVGNPFGLSGSVTTGVVSATGRSVPSKEEGRTYTDFIQTDASINPGNSGGPLLNIEGRVVGINVAIYAQAQGIGFAIPVDRARKVIEDLVRFGEVHRVWIGAVTATLTPEESKRLGMSAARGALVTRVFSGSPSDRAGLSAGDIVTAVGPTQIDSREALTTATATASAGTPLTFRVRRGDRSIDLRVIPTDPPPNIGLRLLREVSGISVTSDGSDIVIDVVTSRSRAAQMGLAPGDVIVGVNGAEVRSVDELDDKLSRGSERSSIVLSVARGRFVYTLTFPMGSEETVL